jgi:hypothetical protein
VAVVAQLMVNIGADTSKFDSGMKDVSQNLSSAGKHALSFGDILKANVLSDAIVGGFSALGGAIGDAAGKLKDFAMQGIQTASDLGEVENVVVTTFGKEGSKVIDDFAKTASTSFGLSELSAKQFTGTMGAMLKSTGLSGKQVEEMSTSITGLSGDFASFYNLPAEEAFAKIRAGISGETEPLKQLGINMSAANLETYALTQGLGKSYKEMSEAEKVALRYNYLMSATADAQGDFAKTSDSYANQQRIMQLNMENLSATIGSQLLPMANGLTTAFNNLLTGASSAEEFGATVGGILTDLANLIMENIPMIIDIGIEIINALLNGIMKSLPDLIGAAGTIFSSLGNMLMQNLPLLIDMGIQILNALINGIIQNLPMIVTSALSIINQLVTALLTMLPQIILMGVQLLIQLALGIAQALPTLIPAIINAVLLMQETLIDNIDLLIDAAIQLMIGLANGLIAALPQIIAKAPIIISKLVTAIINNLPKIIAAAWQIIKSLAGAIISNLPQIMSSAGQIIGTVVRGIVGGIGSINKAMTDIRNNILSSIGGWAGKLWDKAKSIGSSLWKGFKKGIGMGSPSLIERAFMAIEAQGYETVSNLNKLSPRLKAEMFDITEPSSPFTMAGTAAARVVKAPVLTPEEKALRTDNLKTQSNGLTINIYGLTVREDADIEKISQRLYYLQQSNMRGVGGEPSV